MAGPLLTNNTSSHLNSSRHNSVGEVEGSLEGGDDFYATSEDPAPFSGEMKGEVSGAMQQTVKSKQSGEKWLSSIRQLILNKG